MDETRQPGERNPVDGGKVMGAPPGARRYNGDSWPSAAGDDPFEALVSSWGEQSANRPASNGQRVNGRSGGDDPWELAAELSKIRESGTDAEPEPASEPAAVISAPPAGEGAGRRSASPPVPGQQPEAILVPEPATVPIPPEALGRSDPGSERPEPVSGAGSNRWSYRSTPRADRGSIEPSSYQQRPEPGGYRSRHPGEAPAPSQRPTPFGPYGVSVGSNTLSGLPIRTPAPPDVPDVPERDGFAAYAIDDSDPDAPDLDRIADYLTRQETEPTQDDWRPEGFDIPAVIEAVRGVPGVRDAKLRPNPSGVHKLSLDLSDDADPAHISRIIARLLKERMGLATESQPVSGPGYGGQARRRWPTGPGAASAGIPVASAPPASSPYPTISSGRATVGQQRPPFGNQAAADSATWGPEELQRRRKITIERVKVTAEGQDALVEVRLSSGGRPARGVANGPAFDGYVLRLAAVAASAAIDQLLDGVDGRRGRCFVEHAAVVSLGGCDVAVVVLLFSTEGRVEQLSGSAVVSVDPRHAVVTATLAAVGPHLEALMR